MATKFFLLAFLALWASRALASDPSQLQDFCVADRTSQVFVNGFACKDPKTVVVEDFLFSGLHMAGNMSNKQGSAVSAVNVAHIPGLNTLGISLARVDYAPYGQNPPHIHPRASEGLIHFQFNTGDKEAIAIAALSSKNPGVITIANAVFGSVPSISDDILAKAFQVDKKAVDHVQAQF
ncbi:putative germin-like protein 2-1 isoform X2 [Aegilops tauschii subsp. strangulata]|uniref:putative germin-like protein 2-1 isoform X2 n=1 Tax=Aegilops tauschii subsp. strangulata TaxID=200361 RepID=UPI001E1CA269|nr:putative germin-like protein 2-1 isoform X2 [Aegilops tauschii subsp. strangulata]